MPASRDHVTTDCLAITGASVARGVDILAHGGLVAFPTETVYGLGGDACNADAVAAIFAAKERPAFNPLISHVASAEAAFELGTATPIAACLAEAFWPGPMTLILTRRPDCPIALLTSAGLDKIALRVPAHAEARPFLRPSAGRWRRRAPIHQGASARHAPNMCWPGSAAGSSSFWMAALAKAGLNQPLSTAPAIPPISCGPAASPVRLSPPLWLHRELTLAAEMPSDRRGCAGKPRTACKPLRAIGTGQAECHSAGARHGTDRVWRDRRGRRTRAQSEPRRATSRKPPPICST